MIFDYCSKEFILFGWIMTSSSSLENSGCRHWSWYNMCCRLQHSWDTHKCRSSPCLSCNSLNHDDILHRPLYIHPLQVDFEILNMLEFHSLFAQPWTIITFVINKINTFICLTLEKLLSLSYWISMTALSHKHFYLLMFATCCLQ